MDDQDPTGQLGWGPPPAGSAGPAGSWGPPPGRPARSGRSLGLVLAACVAALVAIVAVVGVVATRSRGERLGQPLAAPASVAGIRRLDDPTVVSVVDQATSQFRQGGSQAVGAVYGASLAEPRLFLVAVRGGSDAAPGRRALLERFARAVAPTSGFDAGAVRELRRGGRQLACAPVAGGQVSSACVWSGSRDFITAAYGGTGVEELAGWSDQALDALTA